MSSYIDNIYQILDKFLIFKFFKNFKIIILSIISSLIFLVKHEHFYITRICKYLPLQAVITVLHPSCSNQTDNVRARMKRRKGKRGRRGFRGRVPSCSAGPNDPLTHDALE